MIPPRSLSAEQVASFHELGYLIVPDVFDPADLEPLRQEMHREIGRKAAAVQAAGKLRDLHADLGFDHQLAAIQRDSAENGEAIIKHLEGLRGGGFHAPEMFEVIAHPKMQAAVGSLLRTEEIVASSVYRIRPKLPNSGRGIVPWHQDSGYFATHCDTQLIITCWVPLVDVADLVLGHREAEAFHQGGIAERHLCQTALPTMAQGFEAEIDADRLRPQRSQ